jgi:2-C-methyl-D-erythritol 4-phosphate cytidylyltransferase
VTVVGILAAAGSGERLESEVPKAFVSCGGRPLLAWSLDVLQGTCDRVIVAVPPQYVDRPSRIAGGGSRSESVAKALAACPEATTAVIHDAARPLVTQGLIQRLLSRLDRFDGAVAAVPMSDTVKEVAAADLSVVGTLDRTRLWRVQTPQAFRADRLRHALDVPTGVLASATDDASLVERDGGRVCVVEASEQNIKVTTGTDLKLAEFLIAVA